MDKDNRYDKVFTDPKFWSVPKSQKRLKIDKRFAQMFSDERFCARSAPVDRRGRPMDVVRWKDSSKSLGKGRTDLEKFYELNESEEETKVSADELEQINNSDNNDHDQASESDNAAPAEKKRKKANTQKLHLKGEKAKKMKRSKKKNVTGDIADATCRLAVCNQDWDRLRAIDLLMLFRSFLPPENSGNDAVKRVNIYQSAYGAKRQAIDDTKGPVELRKRSKQGDSDDIDNSDTDAVRDSLVRYQRNRMRYCYAVIECDSPETALSLYQQLDGCEYEASCTKLDLRFIPDEESFDECKVMSVADSEQLTTYEPPPTFITTALGQTAVRLTWEEEQTPERKRALQALLSAGDDKDKDNDDDVGDSEAAQFVAPPSDDDDDGGNDNEEDDDGDDSAARSLASDSDDEPPPPDKYNRYRSLLLETVAAEEEAPAEEAAHMEVTWDPGLVSDSRRETPHDDDDISNDGEKSVMKKKKREKSKAAKSSTKDSHPAADDDVNAFRMMFCGQSDVSDKNAVQIDGAIDPRFAEKLNKPEFHVDSTVARAVKKGGKRKK